MTAEKVDFAITVDANGWTVYDFGKHKEYAKQWTGLSAGSLGSGAGGNTGATGQLMPQGIAPQNFYIVRSFVRTSGAANIGALFDSIDDTSSSTSSTFTISARNLTTATLTLDNFAYAIRLIQKVADA